MSFDIVKQDYSKSAEIGYTFDLILPDGSESGATLTVLGDLSPTVKNYGKKKYREFKQLQDAAKRRGKDWEPTLEEADELSAEAALVRLIGWSGITENGKNVEFTKEKALEILKQHSWIRESIMQESAAISNFTPKTSKN